jgi:hypothetical protein
MEDDAALMAELLAISNKSASSRFGSEFDDDKSDPVPSPKATPRRRRSSGNANSNSLNGDASNSASTPSPSRKGRLASAEKANDIMNSMRKVIESDDVVEESTEDNIRIVSRTPPKTPDRPRSRRNSRSRSRQNSFHSETAGESTSDDEVLVESNTTDVPGSGFQSAPSQFQGERGGAADDADLLAELRAISSKNTSSDRFNGNGDNEEMEPQAPLEKKDLKSPTRTKKVGASKNKVRSPPPWKKKKKGAAKKNDSFDSFKIKGAAADNDGGMASAREEPETDTSVTEAVPEPKSKPMPREELGFADKSQPKTFNGDRGGAAEDDDLLAELRAISMKNSSTNRFQEYDDSDPMSPPPAQIDSPKVKPWQKKSAPKKSPARNKPKPMPREELGFADKSQPKTFNGDRGGAAEDDDLLAELRAISMKNSSTNRFQEYDDSDPMSPPPAQIDSPKVKPWQKKTAPKKSPAQSKKSTPKKDGDELPPWKQKRGAKETEKKTDPFENSMVDDSTSEAQNVFDDFADKAPPKTFNGDRGGAAEDDDLLAELRAISMKNNSTNRFQGGEDDDGDLPPPKPSPKKSPAPRKKSAPKRDGGELPPWKRKAAVKKADPFENSMVDNLPSEPKPMPNETFNDFADKAPPKTFNGDRGGAAEDDDLLAELRAISMKNSSTNRFQGGEDDDGALPPPPPSPKKSPAPRKKSAPKRDGGELPPWKRKAAMKKADPFENSMVDNLPSAPKPKETFGGFADKSQPKTFNGDRGGAAEDDDLIAELRAISMKNSSTNRFQGGGDDENVASPPRKPKPPPMRKKLPAPRTKSSPIKRASPSKSNRINAQQGPKTITIDIPTQNVQPVLVGDDEIVVNEETVSEMLDSKNWKLRKASYDVLVNLMVEKTKGKTPANDMDSDDIHVCINASLPQMAKDTNPSALDSALRLVFLYVDYCMKGCDPDQVKKMVTSVVTGSALSATRPSTAKLVEAVLMKIMEVSRNEPTSIHIVVELLLGHGITSKKPKVVVKSVAMILDAARAFGAATLPLSKIQSSASKMLSHTNGGVRDSTIQILAEICRAVGSKDPLSDIIESMRSAQVSELDALLSKQSEPLPPEIGLRYATSSSASAPDALELLKAGAADDAAARFEEREPVNIFDSLKGTDYKAKMKEKKWSEKTGALDILIKCGGETPYKLMQPSSYVNYNPLISDLNKLLSHTHFAVRSKTMQALGMLAEGVGEKLFSHLKPLLLVLLGLMKDKKVTRASNACLDALFGNVIGFSHMLEKEDGLSIILNEKKQKSALVRQSSLAFVARCVERSEKAGPRGVLNRSHAEGIAELCIKKLKDSEAIVRTECLTVLKALLNHDDESIESTALQCTRGLEQSNPRAYKAIFSSSGGVKQSRPPLTGGAPRSPSRSSGPSSPKRRSNLPDSFQSKGSPKRRSNLPNSFNKSSARKKKPTSSSRPSSKASKKSQSVSSDSEFSVVIDESTIPPLDDARDYIAALDVPNWDADEEEGGVLSGLQSSNWKFRKTAIDTLVDFTKSTKAMSEGETYAANVLVLVKFHTKLFKDSNFNILKSAAELFIAACDLFESLKLPMKNWMCHDAASICVTKIADKKFASVAPTLLTRLCEMQFLEIIFYFSISTIKPIKSPVPHEGLLVWAENICREFGAKAIGKCLSITVGWVSKVGQVCLHAILRI